MSEAKKEILNYALKEFQRVLMTVKDGQPPASSRELKKIISTLTEAETQFKNNKISEKDLEDIEQSLVNRINKKKDK